MKGVRKVPTKKEAAHRPTGLDVRYWNFIVIESRIEDTTGERGLIENFFVDGLLGLFGPFLLWIGGALILGRIAAFGPRFFSILFGWTPLLKDIRRGLKAGGSSESIGRLATIMVLTLSIVTLAAVQGATGTLVDDRTAESQTGSVMSVQFDEPKNQTQINAIFESNINNLGLDVDPIRSTAVNSLTVATVDGSISPEAWVVLDGHEDVLLFGLNNPSQVMISVRLLLVGPRVVLPQGRRLYLAYAFLAQGKDLMTNLSRSSTKIPER